MQSNILFIPPVIFLVVFTALLFLSWGFSKLAFFAKDSSKGSKKSYSCGEEFDQHMIQPDYRQFFPFAFFFTILHVVCLVVATVPLVLAGATPIIIVYLIGVIINLLILLRRD